MNSNGFPLDFSIREIGFNKQEYVAVAAKQMTHLHNCPVDVLVTQVLLHALWSQGFELFPSEPGQRVVCFVPPTDGLALSALSKTCRRDVGGMVKVTRPCADQHHT